MGREVNHSPPSNDGGEWNYTSDTPMYLHGVDRENIIFYNNSKSDMSGNAKL
jgi:hypothetical protein